jgi:membrane associated rhomboid family serine protease
MNFNEGKFGSGRPRMTFGPGLISPFVKLMLISNLAVFVMQGFWPQLTSIAGFTPARFFSEFPNLLYQPFTYMFLHGSFGHILFNMFALWMFGTEVELALGPKRFGRFYLLGGLAGAFMTMIIASGQTIPIVGASAAIYSVLIAYWLMFPQRKLYI